MNTKHTCHYAVVRFLPYRETGEFVNVGVVIYCRETGFFDVVFETQKRKRITDFFPELDANIFRLGRQAFYEELRRVRALLTNDYTDLDDNSKFSIFCELIRTRESIFRFGEPRTILADDPAAKLADLFERYVNRQFAQSREYQETVMTRKVTEVLRANHLLGQYKLNRTVGNEQFHVLLPIVSTHHDNRGVALRAIKTLDLNKDETTKIYDHGDAWIKRVERLRQVNQLPEGMLFTILYPTGDDEKRLRASAEIQQELINQEVRVLPYGDDAGVVEFANFN